MTLPTDGGVRSGARPSVPQFYRTDQAVPCPAARFTWNRFWVMVVGS